MLTIYACLFICFDLFTCIKLLYTLGAVVSSGNGKSTTVPVMGSSEISKMRILYSS